ncbi:MAG TPA: PH domain-containing protein [Acidimicrobiales bacterium]
MPTAPGDSPGWQRLHRLSPVVRVGRLAPAIVVVLVLGAEDKAESRSGEIIYLIVFGIVSVVLGIIHWIVTRYMIEGDTLRIETGLLRRDSKRLPLTRIQAIDVVTPFTARLFGLAELRIRLAGSGSTDGRLAYLTQADAAALRLRLLSGHREQTPIGQSERPDVVMASVGTGRLIASVLLSLVTILLIGTVLALVILDHVAHKAAAGALGFLAAYLLSFGGVIWRRITGQYHFEALDGADGVHIRRGLFQTVSETVPFGRIQAVRQVQPFLWRPLGWCRLEVDIAGAGSRQGRGEGTGVVRKALHPVGTVQETWPLIERLMSGAAPVRTPPPKRARIKAPFSYHFLSAGHDDTHVVCVTGRLNRTTTWVPLEKTQSVRRTQGPAQRRLGLATVHVDAAGHRTRAEFRDRPLEEADALVATLPELSRQARRRVVAPRPMAPALSPPAAPAVPPAGWFVDPSGHACWRYWDGAQWTAHISDGATTRVDPAGTS